MTLSKREKSIVLAALGMFKFMPHDHYFPDSKSATDAEIEELCDRINSIQSPDDVSGEDEKYDRATWRLRVYDCDTNLGYWEWVQHRREAESMKYPVIYELDGNLEANGTIHWFCSDACLCKSKDRIIAYLTRNGSEQCLTSIGDDDSWFDGMVCEGCGNKLGAA